MVDIVKNIQNVAQQTYEASKPMRLVYGEVTSTSPLIVLVEQKLELSQEFLVLTRNVIDYDVEITENPDNGGTKMKYRIHNQLKQGETVLMLRDNNGQRYVIIDKVVNL